MRMAMTPSEMIEFFQEQAAGWSQGLRMAVGKANYHHAAGCLRQIFKDHLMQGLITWRIGCGSPVEPLKSAVNLLREGVETLESMKEANPARDLPLDSASIISFLVDIPSPSFRISEMTADRLLDAVLGNGLRGDWNEMAWNNGLEQLRKNKRAALAAETYLTYGRLLHSDGADASGLVDRATRLFVKRAKDGYFSGGDQTEGGGPDNTTTVDYRLAAVMKKIGYLGENLHRWRWT